jgi:hypothetical protein
MKKLATTCIVLIAGFLFTNAFAQVEKPKQLVEAPSNDSVKLKHGTVVPANQTYNVYDENGVLLGTYSGGKTVTVPESKGKAKKKLDCVEISCPKTFRKGTVCWRCK